MTYSPIGEVRVSSVAPPLEVLTCGYRLPLEKTTKRLFGKRSTTFTGSHVFMAQVKPVAYRLPQVENVRLVNREKPREVSNKRVPSGSRCGLELIFEATPDKKTVTKLRLNGWWWSKARSCWCNTNTTDNRKYVRTTFSGCPFHLIAIT